MSFTISMNGQDRVLDKFDKLKNDLENFEPILDEVGEYIISKTDETFASQGGAIQESWAPLTPQTLYQKQRLGFGGKGILERTGALRKGFFKEVQKFLVRVTNKMSYYKYHQLGGKTLPQRVMLKSTENMKQDIVEIFNKSIRESL